MPFVPRASVLRCPWLKAARAPPPIVFGKRHGWCSCHRLLRLRRCPWTAAFQPNRFCSVSARHGHPRTEACGHVDGAHAADMPRRGTPKAAYPGTRPHPPEVGRLTASLDHPADRLLLRLRRVAPSVHRESRLRTALAAAPACVHQSRQGQIYHLHRSISQ